MADSSSVRKRLAAELKMDNANEPTAWPLDSDAGRFTKLPPTFTGPKPLEFVALE
jgi:hypothetical protein